MIKELQCLDCLKWKDKLNGEPCFSQRTNDNRSYCAHFVKNKILSEYVNKKARKIKKERRNLRKINAIRNELEKL